MTIRMTSLRRAPNGDWFARRMIPEDVTGWPSVSPKRPGSVPPQGHVRGKPSRSSGTGTQR
jgi:hypothetical protein